MTVSVQQPRESNIEIYCIPHTRIGMYFSHVTAGPAAERPFS